MVDRRSGHGRGGKPVTTHGVANLVGGGPSLVGPVGAMRARDVSRPREADYARAEKTLVVRRRPPDAAPAAPLAVPVESAPESPVVPPVDQSSAGESEPLDS